MARDNDEDINVNSYSKIDSAKGKLKFSKLNDKLMHSVIKNDKKNIEKGKVLQEALNKGITSFNPDMMFEQLVNNYRNAENIYGEKLLRFVSGYNPDYIERNIKVPEFRTELRKRIDENIQDLKKDKLLGEDNELNDKSLELASLTLYVEELENIKAKGYMGENVHKRKSHYGDKLDVHDYKKGDRYKDISISKSVKTAIRRGHKDIDKKDLKVHSRGSKGTIEIVYALDASGSMKGDKILMAKKAGIALAYKAIDKKDKVGLVVFGQDIKESIDPSNDFQSILMAITKIRPMQQTDLIKTIEHSANMFSNKDVTKHLIIITDAMPTIGKDPEKDTLKAVSLAKNKKITISIVGIDLEKKGKELAEKIAEVGEGRLYTVRNLEEMDQIVLEDYYSFK